MLSTKGLFHMDVNWIILQKMLTNIEYKTKSTLIIYYQIRVGIVLEIIKSVLIEQLSRFFYKYSHIGTLCTGNYYMINIYVYIHFKANRNEKKENMVMAGCISSGNNTAVIKSNDEDIKWCFQCICFARHLPQQKLNKTFLTKIKIYDRKWTDLWSVGRFPTSWSTRLTFRFRNHFFQISDRFENLLNPRRTMQILI